MWHYVLICALVAYVIGVGISAWFYQDVFPSRGWGEAISVGLTWPVLFGAWVISLILDKTGLR